KLKSKNPEIIILEKTSKVLAKVKISGGGRCNVSNANSKLSELLENYPRGAKELRKVFKSFSVTETVEWFQKRGVKLKTEDDGRMFPITNSSQTIINCLENSCEKGEVRIILNSEVKSISRKLESIEVNCIEKSFQCDYLIVTTGGFPKTSGYSFLESTGHTIIEPAPSLFTFNLKDKTLTKLMGVSVHLANVKISGTKLQYAGPLLIT
ncbi:MAG: aminoacetone oxidase family FAD-binding enzyme, partial [Bacteroidota bacterium]